MTIAPFFTFLKSVFSEPTGEGSCARVLSAVFAVAAIAWVTHVVIHTHAIPPLTDITVWISAPYAVNKVTTAAGKQ
jgi:hypothetical protein